MRILLIEDDLNFCETLRFQLEQEAYEAVSHTHLTLPTIVHV